MKCSLFFSECPALFLAEGYQCMEVSGDSSYSLEGEGREQKTPDGGLLLQLPPGGKSFALETPIEV